MEAWEKFRPGETSDCELEKIYKERGTTKF